MKIVFETFDLVRQIPVQDYLKNKKLMKYFNRETAAAIVCLGKLTADMLLSADTSFYYATGVIEYEDYGLSAVAAGSQDVKGRFSPAHFISRGMASVSPLTQFKVLYNMPLCFVSIEYGLTGDNAVIYSSAAALIRQARYSSSQQVLMGAGKVYHNGKTESGFALLTKEEATSFELETDYEAIELFRKLHQEVNG